MPTIRRVLICGHIQRMSTYNWDHLNEATPVTEMACKGCKGAVRRIVGMVPRKWQPQPEPQTEE